MIKINRNQLSELAYIYLVANTPLSLLNALKRNEAVLRMKDNCSYNHLKEYYGIITGRARRDETVMGLSYAVLVAILLHERTEGHLPDCARLEWGDEIKKYVSASNRSNLSIVINGSPATTRIDNSPSSVTILGSNGRPLRRNII